MDSLWPTKYRVIDTVYTMLRCYRLHISSRTCKGLFCQYTGTTMGSAWHIKSRLYNNFCTDINSLCIRLITKQVDRHRSTYMIYKYMNINTDVDKSVYITYILFYGSLQCPNGWNKSKGFFPFRNQARQLTMFLCIQPKCNWGRQDADR